MAPQAERQETDIAVCGRSERDVAATLLNLQTLDPKRVFATADQDYKLLDAVNRQIGGKLGVLRGQIDEVNESFYQWENVKNYFTKGYVKVQDRLAKEFEGAQADSKLLRELRTQKMTNAGLAEKDFVRPEAVFKTKDLPEQFEMAKNLRTDQLCQNAVPKFDIVETEVKKRISYTTGLRNSVLAIEQEPTLKPWIDLAKKDLGLATK